MTDPTDHARPTPKRLILSLLSAPTLQKIEVGQLIRWGGLFGIEPAATRVAVGRLAKQGFITALERGIYSIGPEGSLLARTAGNWVRAEEKVGPWSGGWIVVHTSHLGRTNKTVLRARERSFRLHGFVEYVTGLWCRPDNLRQPLALTREALVSLGMEPAAVLMQVSDIPGVGESELFRLWPRKQLESGYRASIRAMDDSLERLPRMSLEDAARETFLVGESVIRRINEDPLLPGRMIDTAARRSMIRGMVEYNGAGRSVWVEFGRDQPA